MTIEQALQEAHAEAQAAFKAMLDAGSYSDPFARETIAYGQAERLVDNLLVEAQWQRSKAELDAIQSADPEYTDHMTMAKAEADRFEGDHHVYPNGVGR